MMKKIIITGGCGYIGMELCKTISGQSRTHNITVIDNAFYSTRVAQLKRWGIQYKQIDILDSQSLSEEINDADIIYHLAGITDVGATIEDKNHKRDNKIKKVGIEGTKNIIKYSGVNTKIIFPSTHVVFEGLKQVKKNIDEKYQPVPVLEYAKGKYKSEQDLLKSNKNFVILRLGSVYGKSYDSTRLNIMPNLFSKITASDGEIKLFNNGKQLKSLVSVVDVARCLEFVAQNTEINRDIFNCVNESLRVADVAAICSKINKKVKITKSNEAVPNNGYSLSNKKIKSFGFKFVNNINNSIEEMYDYWKDHEIDYSNEILESGKDEYVDERGIISNYYIEDNINMIGYVESKKNTVRGNHFHPIQTQKCLLVKGQYISVTKDLKDPNSVTETRLVNEGQLSTIPPYVAHTMVFLEDSIFLNLVNGEREHDNYGITHTKRFELVSSDFATNLLDNYKNSCRVCNSKFLITYLSLGTIPLANNLTESKEEDSAKFPLELNFCNICTNTQLSIVVPPKEMFDKYLYLSSTTQQFKNHFKSLAKLLTKNLKLNKNSVVVDIGSNDGIFIDPLLKLDIKAVGVEPAKNIAKIANSLNLPTYPEYFTEKTVEKIKKKHGASDLVTAFNVFAHNDKLLEMLLNIQTLLKKSGTFVFEVQYILKTIGDLTFDNIYHEHVNYWSLTSLMALFKKSELKIYKIEHIDTHGGSIRVYASKNKEIRSHTSIKATLQNEKESGIANIETYYKFAEDVKNIKKESLEKLKVLKKENKKIVGFGAPAKATTLLNYFGITSKDIEFTIEDNEMKHNKFIPGTEIEIRNITQIDTSRYAYVLVLAWNFFEIIKQNNKKHFKTSKFIKFR